MSSTRLKPDLVSNAAAAPALGLRQLQPPEHGGELPRRHRRIPPPAPPAGLPQRPAVLVVAAAVDGEDVPLLVLGRVPLEERRLGAAAPLPGGGPGLPQAGLPAGGPARGPGRLGRQIWVRGRVRRPGGGGGGGVRPD